MVARGAMGLFCILARDGFGVRCHDEVLLMESATDAQRLQETV
jgi:hypothetical protein